MENFYNSPIGDSAHPGEMVWGCSTNLESLRKQIWGNNVNLPYRLIMNIWTPELTRFLRPFLLRFMLGLNNWATLISKVTLGCLFKNSMIEWLQEPQGLQLRNQMMWHLVVLCFRLSSWLSKALISACWEVVLVHQFLHLLWLFPHWISYRT